MRYIVECNLYFTSLFGGVVRQIFDNLNLVVSLAGDSTEVSDLGAHGNNRTPLNNSVPTRQVLLGQGNISGGITNAPQLASYSNPSMKTTHKMG